MERKAHLIRVGGRPQEEDRRDGSGHEEAKEADQGKEEGKNEKYVNYLYNMTMRH